MTARPIRSHAWGLVCLGLAAVLYFLWSSTQQIGSFANDGPDYLMMVRHYAPFGSESAVNAGYAAFSRFPPVYPLLLALAGTGADLHAVHLATTAFLLVALALYYAWLLTAGLARPQAALLLLLAAVMPGTWLQALTVQSEYLYLLWSLLALLLLALHERAEHAYRYELLYAAALAVAAAVLTRTIGLALLAPLLLAAWRAPLRRGVLAMAVAVMPLLLWHLLHRSHLGYSEALGDIYGRHAGHMLTAQIAGELPALRAGFADNLLHAPLSLQPLLDVLGLLLLAGALGRAVQLKADGIYLLVYLAIVLVWPYPEEAWRFLSVVLPLAAAQWLLLLAALLRTTADATLLQRCNAVFALAVLMLALPSVNFAAERYNDASGPSLLPARGLVAWYDPDLATAVHSTHAQQVLMASMRRIGAEIPADDCVIAIRPDLINYYAGRNAAQPPLNSVPDPRFQELLRAPGCRYAFMSTMTHMMFPLPLHPAQRLGEHIEVLDYVDEADPPPADGQVTAILAVIGKTPAP
jgi:hypothetical protein